MIDRSRFRNHLREEDLLAWDDVLIVGCGGIGSWLAVGLAKVGFKTFDLIDPDHVDDSNVATQVFTIDHTGISKVKALAAVLSKINPDVNIDRHERAWGASDKIDGLFKLICLVTDNIPSRKMVWEAVKRLPKETNPLILDARTGLESVEVNIFRREHPFAKDYDASLKAPLESYSTEGCGATSIPYNSMLCAAIAVSMVRQHVAGGPPNREPRVEPFTGLIAADSGAPYIRSFPWVSPTVVKT